jgi:hypothetical protein
MPKIYATQDYYGDRIEHDAFIACFDTEAEAREYLLAPYRHDDWDISTAEIAPGRFSDCWIKTHYKPQIEAGLYDCAPFSPDELSVRGPGEHPGGRQWWITPTPDVLVVAIIRQREEL